MAKSKGSVKAKPVYTGKSIKSLAPNMHQGMGRVLELQGRFNNAMSINAPHGKKSPASSSTPLLVKHGGGGKKLKGASRPDSFSANRGEKSQVGFGQR